MGALSEGLNILEEEKEPVKKQEKKQPFALWKVGDTEYKLKLTTQEIIRLESMFNANLLSVISSNTENNEMPPLKVMLLITHGAIKKYNHGIKEKDVIELFDKYEEEGGSQLSFMTDVFLPIFQVSGFFSQAQADTMNENIEEAKEQM
nr:MAG TPA: tail assembly chaperone [Caudoviricetes sp.]